MYTYQPRVILIELDKIGDIIGKRMNQHQLGESARASAVLLKANTFLHGSLRCTENEVSAFRIKDGVLYVGTFGSGWNQEVFLRQESLMKAVRKEYGERSVLKIVIKSLTNNIN